MLLLALTLAACASTAPTGPPAPPSFPAVDRAALSDAQLRVVDVLRAQYDAQRPGPSYSEGADEPWCANFVSWVMREAGVALANPNSGWWRIPGVYTLQEYYEAAGRFAPPGYVPAPGDVVLYGPESSLGLHANVVVAVDGATLVTVGGNEAGGIRVGRYDASQGGLLGFGRLP